MDGAVMGGRDHEEPCPVCQQMCGGLNDAPCACDRSAVSARPARRTSFDDGYLSALADVREVLREVAKSTPIFVDNIIERARMKRPERAAAVSRPNKTQEAKAAAQPKRAMIWMLDNAGVSRSDLAAAFGMSKAAIYQAIFKYRLALNAAESKARKSYDPSTQRLRAAGAIPRGAGVAELRMFADDNTDDKAAP